MIAVGLPRTRGQMLLVLEDHLSEDTWSPGLAGISDDRLVDPGQGTSTARAMRSVPNAVRIAR